MPGQMRYAQVNSSRRVVVQGGRDFSAGVVLKCGHRAAGVPPVSNPDQWFCTTCHAWKGRRA